jgi:hypothetical protein
MYFTTTTKTVVWVLAYKLFKIKIEIKIQVTFLFVCQQIDLLERYESFGMSTIDLNLKVS